MARSEVKNDYVPKGFQLGPGPIRGHGFGFTLSPDHRQALIAFSKDFVPGHAVEPVRCIVNVGLVGLHLRRAGSEQLSVAPESRVSGKFPARKCSGAGNVPRNSFFRDDPPQESPCKMLGRVKGLHPSVHKPDSVGVDGLCARIRCNSPSTERSPI